MTLEERERERWESERERERQRERERERDREGGLKTNLGRNTEIAQIKKFLQTYFEA